MKRKDAPESPLPAKHHPRQDPVSCQSCRKKKLKCDRQQPCSSCLTRHLPCSFRNNPPPVHIENAAKPARPAWSQPPESPQKDSPGPAPPGTGFVGSKESLATADWLEHIHMGDRVPAAVSPQLRAELNEKRLGYDEVSGAAHVLLSITSQSWSPNQNPATVDLIQFLPAESDSLALFSYFCRYISYLYHIIIPHVVEGQINEVYRCVERRAPVNRSHLALVFAITGSSLFLQCSIQSSRHAAMCSQRFSFLTGAALTQADYRSYPTVEGLQAALIIFHNISHIHCCTAVSGFFTIGSIIDQAKAMLLHRVDTQSQEGSEENTVMLETKRRLWWDIASFDWCLGFLSGPQEWTYLVNPAFTYTNKPGNIDDTDMANSPISQPSTTPTAMSFFLERLKLAETCRYIVDTISAEQLTGTEVEYSKILDLDRKIQDTQAQSPDFLRLDPSSRRRYAALYKDHPTIAWQGCILQQAWYSRLCRLHRPFFIRGARDPTYSYSYMTGLSAARKVLEIKRLMDEEEPRFSPSSSMIWSIMHHVFMAAVMLLLDVCYNADDILADKRKEEVLDACRMLSKAQQSSALVKEGIDAMMGVLQGNYNRIGNPVSTTSGLVPGVRVDALDSQMLAPPVVVEGPMRASFIDPSASSDRIRAQEDRDLEEIWSDLIDNGGNMDFDAEDWTGLFSNLTRGTQPPT